MTFDLILSTVFYGLLSVALLVHGTGAAKQAKALLIALGTAVAVGWIIGFTIVIACMLLLDLSSEWSGIAVYAFGLFTGVAAGVLDLIIVFIISLRRLKPSTPNPILRKVSLCLGAILLLFTSVNLYQTALMFQPTSKLIGALGGPGENAAEDELVRRGEDVIQALLDAANEDPYAHYAYVLPRIIGRIPGEDSTRALFTLLGNLNPDVRFHAACQLGLRKEKRALDALLAQLAYPDYSASQKAGIINAIVQYGDASVVPRMLPVLPAPASTPQENFQYLFYELAIIRAMGTLKHPQAYEFLIGLRTHPSARIRTEVIEQLQYYPCRRTALVLIELLGDPDTSVRRKADWAMAQIAGVPWNSSGRRHTVDGSLKIRLKWTKWMEKNGGRLAEKPSFSYSTSVRFHQSQ